jgi:hypothetical protein
MDIPDLVAPLALLLLIGAYDHFSEKPGDEKQNPEDKVMGEVMRG